MSSTWVLKWTENSKKKNSGAIKTLLCLWYIIYNKATQLQLAFYCFYFQSLAKHDTNKITKVEKYKWVVNTLNYQTSPYCVYITI